MPRKVYNKGGYNRRKCQTLKIDKSKEILKKKSNDSDIYWIQKLCHECLTVEQQISSIVKKFGASKEYFHNVANIIQDLNKLIKACWPGQGIMVYSFGSSVTQLALTGSDLDAFIDFKGNIPKNIHQVLRDVIKGSGLFSRTIAIPARVPIVNCIHKKSRISCDISFTALMGVYNTELITFVVRSDSRLKPLIMLTKYLMKKSVMIPTKQFTSFSIIVLYMYFLQQLDQPIIPPISLLQSLSDSTETTDGWNVSFTRNSSLLPTVENTMTVPQLLKGFFKFYSEFDFGLYVISSFMGKKFLRSEFANPDLLPNDYTCYKEKLRNGVDCRLQCDTPMCVQGPFNHGNNILRNISVDNMKKFQNFCRTSYLILEKMGYNFGTIFLELLKNDGSSRNPEEGNKMERMIYVGKKSDLMNSQIYTESDMRSHWYEIVFKNLTTILTKVLKCDINEDSENVKAVEGTSKIISCKIGHPELVMNVRKEAASNFNFPKDMSHIIRQELISNYLLDTSLRGRNQDPISFGVKCSFLVRPTRVDVDLTLMEQDRRKVGMSLEVLHSIERDFLPLLQAIV